MGATAKSFVVSVTDCASIIQGRTYPNRGIKRRTRGVFHIRLGWVIEEDEK